MPQLPDVPLDGLYGDLVMEHFRSPRNSALINDADVEGEEFNPFCGD
ncbi:MAG: iron-sulfur cluster assembly scaffold protein, partial [SAR202 cluster bacterium]|nr:iron-sulfur cluster assembly scaffold protein [SAR202 cluster bacterium]